MALFGCTIHGMARIAPKRTVRRARSDSCLRTSKHGARHRERKGRVPVDVPYAYTLHGQRMTHTTTKYDDRTTSKHSKTMLRSYLAHQMDRALRGDITNALAHCHAKGVHSIVFQDEPQNRIRMFLADSDHNLYRNSLTAIGKQPFTLAIHPHHCNLRFVGIYGRAQNTRYAVVPDTAGSMQEMEYRSGVLTPGGAMLAPTGRRGIPVLRSNELLLDNPTMHAQELHSIYAPIGESSAWLVIEGAEDPQYRSTCWTNDPRPDLTGLYVPMTQAQIVHTLQRAIDGYRNRTDTSDR